MAERTCRCGTSFAVHPRERNTRLWCSDACRCRSYYEAEPDRRVERNLRRRQFPSKAISYATCEYCTRLFVVRRAPSTHRPPRCCRQSECRRLYNNDRVRGFFHDYRERTGKAYTARYQDKRRANNQMRRLRTRGAEAVERFLPSEIFERDGWRCGICGKRIGKKPWPHPLSATVDHIVPLSEGGQHTRANVRTAHLGCNSGRRERGGGEQLRLIG